MGQGEHLWIINATSKTLKAVNTISNLMKIWQFSDIPSQSQEKFYIEYSDKTKSRDAGETTFLLEGTSSSFRVLIDWPNKEGECGLMVDWGGITTGDYHVFPPVLEGERFGKLGWIHNGSLSLLIMENGVATSVSTHLPGEDSIVSSKSTEEFPEAPVYKNWMEHYSGILGKLTLGEMTLPGTHDSGTHKPEFSIAAPWVKMQELSLAQQLGNGIRVLDWRIGQKSPGDYIICHDEWKTSYSLAEALKEVIDFIDGSSKEIVILDFHWLLNLSSL